MARFNGLVRVRSFGPVTRLFANAFPTICRQVAVVLCRPEFGRPTAAGIEDSKWPPTWLLSLGLLILLEVAIGNRYPLDVDAESGPASKFFLITCVRQGIPIVGQKNPAGLFPSSRPANPQRGSHLTASRPGQI